MCNGDLGLEQLLADPMVRLVMSSDGVDESQIRGLAKRVALHLKAAIKPPADQGTLALA